MNLRDLKYIVSVAETLNFNRAAELCHVSQPSLSKQIQKVEDEIGAMIFERTNRKVRLTPSGEQIVLRARVVLREADAIRQIAREASDPLSGEFRLGIIPTVAPYLLPRLMPLFRRQLPRLNIFLHEGHTGTIVQQLLRGELDAVLLALPLSHDELREEELYNEPFLLAVPAKHALAERKRVSIRELAKETLLLLEDGHCLREQALQVCRMSGSAEDGQFRATSLETLRQMVASGSGTTLMPQLAAEKASHVKYVPFKDPSPSRLIGLAWRKSSPRRKLLEKMAGLIRKDMKDMPRKGVKVIPIKDGAA